MQTVCTVNSFIAVMSRPTGKHRATFSRPTTRLTILIALPGVAPEEIKVTLSAGVLIVSGERPLPPEMAKARIHRLEIPHGHFQRRIELPPVRFEISGRHLANGCLMVQLHKL